VSLRVEREESNCVETSVIVNTVRGVFSAFRWYFLAVGSCEEEVLGYLRDRVGDI